MKRIVGKWRDESCCDYISAGWKDVSEQVSSHKDSSLCIFVMYSLDFD